MSILNVRPKVTLAHTMEYWRLLVNEIRDALDLVFFLDENKTNSDQPFHFVNFDESIEKDVTLGTGSYLAKKIEVVEGNTLTIPDTAQVQLIDTDNVPFGTFCKQFQIIANQRCQFDVPVNSFGTIRLCIKTTDLQTSVTFWNYMAQNETFILSTPTSLSAGASNLGALTQQDLAFQFVPTTDGEAFVHVVFATSSLN